MNFKSSNIIWASLKLYEPIPSVIDRIQKNVTSTELALPFSSFFVDFFKKCTYLWKRTEISMTDIIGQN